jgi:hypothetical protein
MPPAIDIELNPEALVKVNTPRFLGSVHDPQGTPGAPQSQEYAPFQGMARCIWQTQPVPMRRAHFMVEGGQPGLRITQTPVTEPASNGLLGVKYSFISSRVGYALNGYRLRRGCS